MKKQIEVTVCDFCNKEATIQTIYGKDICLECFEKFASICKVSLHSKTLTKEIELIIEECNLNCTVEEFKNKVKWEIISKYQNLSEEFIEKFEYKVDWYFIAKYQTLSEKFIEKFQDKVDWNYISAYQNLSEEFIEKFQDNVHWKYISLCQKLSPEFRKKWKHKLK